MDNFAKVHAVLAVIIISQLVMANAQALYYNSPGGVKNQEYEKIVEHITPIGTFYPATQVYNSPQNSYGYPRYYRNVPMEEPTACQQKARQARGLYLAPYPGPQAQHYHYHDGPDGSWYHLSSKDNSMNYQPAMRSPVNQQMFMLQSQPSGQQQFYYQPDETNARSMRTFGPLRDLLPGLFSGDNEHAQQDVAYHTPQTYNNIPPMSQPSAAPIQSYY